VGFTGLFGKLKISELTLSSKSINLNIKAIFLGKEVGKNRMAYNNIQKLYL
jgi:hypothetical protein